MDNNLPGEYIGADSGPVGLHQDTNRNTEDFKSLLKTYNRENFETTIWTAIFINTQNISQVKKT